MKFRWKLLLLMLAVSILPMVVLRTFGIHTVRSMAEALSEEVQKGRLEAARNEIQSLLNGSREALNMERERVAMALSVLSDVLRPGPSPQIDERPESQGPIDPAPSPVAANGHSSRLCVLTPKAGEPATRREAAWLMQAGETFAAIAEHLGEMVLRQDLAYTSGVTASFPCPHAGLDSGDATKENWYRDAFWAYTPLPHQGSALVMIVPAADLLEPAQPVQAAIRERLRRVEMLTAGFLVLLTVVNAAVVLVFSRTVTRPLETLSKAAAQLAAGDFDSRVDIASKDEFGSMGAVFNRVGPQLKEHYRVREALRAAVEIQQSLLPKSPPSLPGLDISAMSLYSEKIGSDYYDYLCVREGGQQRLYVAVGDVSGHGISSAITMATVRGFLRLRASLPGALGEIVSDVNRKLVEDVEYSGQFMTLFLSRIDGGVRRMERVRAGHDPGIL